MSEISASVKTLAADESAVLRCVLYFSLFSYPLQPNEILENCSVNCEPHRFSEILETLCANGLLKRSGEFYLCKDADEKTISRRLVGNAGAASVMGIAFRYSKTIATFPFVRGVFLSGALSKNYYDDKGDIDYFIVTTPGRLWICRTLLILRYKMLPANKKKFWCVNYFISSDNLVIPDQNVFTATEIAYLIPACNYELYRMFMNCNRWYSSFYPHKSTASAGQCTQEKRGLVKKLAEACFYGWGNVFDDFLLRITLKNWQKKYPYMRTEDFELQFRSRKNVCKRHNTGFQNKVLEQWHHKIKTYERDHNILLSV